MTTGTLIANLPTYTAEPIPAENVKHVFTFSDGYKVLIYSDGQYVYYAIRTPGGVIQNQTRLLTYPLPPAHDTAQIGDTVYLFVAAGAPIYLTELILAWNASTHSMSVTTTPPMLVSVPSSVYYGFFSASFLGVQWDSTRSVWQVAYCGATQSNAGSVVIQSITDGNASSAPVPHATLDQALTSPTSSYVGFDTRINGNALYVTVADGGRAQTYCLPITLTGVSSATAGYLWNSAQTESVYPAACRHAIELDGSGNLDIVFRVQPASGAHSIQTVKRTGSNSFGSPISIYVGVAASGNWAPSLSYNSGDLYVYFPVAINFSAGEIYVAQRSAGRWQPAQSLIGGNAAGYNNSTTSGTFDGNGVSDIIYILWSGLGFPSLWYLGHQSGGAPSVPTGLSPPGAISSITPSLSAVYQNASAADRQGSYEIRFTTTIATTSSTVGAGGTLANATSLPVATGQGSRFVSGMQITVGSGGSQDTVYVKSVVGDTLTVTSMTHAHSAAEAIAATGTLLVWDSGRIKDASGSIKANTTLGAVSLILQTGQGSIFAIGQQVFVGSGANVEVVTISGITGDTLTVSACTKTHSNNDPVWNAGASLTGILYGQISNTADVNYFAPAALAYSTAYSWSIRTWDTVLQLASSYSSATVITPYHAALASLLAVGTQGASQSIGSVSSTVAGTGIAVGAVSLPVQTGDGAKFSVGQQLVLGQNPSIDFVTISSIVGDTLTITATRYQHGVGDSVVPTSGNVITAASSVLNILFGYTQQENHSTSQYQFVLYASDGVSIVAQSAWANLTLTYDTSYNAPTWNVGSVMQNGAQYKLQVNVIDATTGVTSSSPQWTINTSWTAPVSPINFQITPDNQNGRVSLNWENLSDNFDPNGDFSQASGSTGVCYGDPLNSLAGWDVATGSPSASGGILSLPTGANVQCNFLGYATSSTVMRFYNTTSADNGGGTAGSQFAWRTLRQPNTTPPLIGQIQPGSFIPASDFAHYYQIEVNGQTSQVVIYKMASGVSPQVLATFACALTAGTWYWLTVAVSVSGGVSTITAKISADSSGSIGTQIMSTSAQTDQALTAAGGFALINTATGVCPVRIGGATGITGFQVLAPLPAGWTINDSATLGLAPQWYAWMSDPTAPGSGSVLAIHCACAGLNGSGSWRSTPSAFGSTAYLTASAYGRYVLGSTGMQQQLSYSKADNTFLQTSAVWTMGGNNQWTRLYNTDNTIPSLAAKVAHFLRLASPNGQPSTVYFDLAQVELDTIMTPWRLQGQGGVSVNIYYRESTASAWTLMQGGTLRNLITFWPKIDVAYDYAVSHVNAAGIESPLNDWLQVILGLRNGDLGMWLNDLTHPDQIAVALGTIDNWDTSTQWDTNINTSFWVPEGRSRPIALDDLTIWHTASQRKMFIPRAEANIDGSVTYGLDLIKTMRTLIANKTNLLYRDPDGELMFVRLTKLSRMRAEANHFMVYFDLTEIDYQGSIPFV